VIFYKQVQNSNLPSAERGQNATSATPHIGPAYQDLETLSSMSHMVIVLFIVAMGPRVTLFCAGGATTRKNFEYFFPKKRESMTGNSPLILNRFSGSNLGLVEDGSNRKRRYED
jgi:hypothetical protein